MKLKEYVLDYAMVEILKDGSKELYRQRSRQFAENKIHAVNQVLDEWKDHPDKLSHFEKIRKVK